MKKCLLIPDTHRPFHSIKAYNLMLDVALDLKPDEIVILGDYADFYAVSSHGKHPKQNQLLIEEIEDVNAGLDQLDQLFPEARKVFIEGNHEFRLERYLSDKAPALFGLTEVKFLFKINQRPNWLFIPYGPNQIYQVADSYLSARHEPLAPTAKGTAAKALCNLVYGHIHRIEESHLVGLDGRNNVCFSVGWLGDKRLDRVFNYVKNHHQWQMGFGIVYVDKDRWFYHQKIHILENFTCQYNGKVYRG